MTLRPATPRWSWQIPSGVSAEYLYYTGSNGSGMLTEAIVDWTSGGSEELLFNPQSGVSELIGNFTGANATGTLTSEIYDLTAGGSQEVLFNPQSNVSSEILFFIPQPMRRERSPRQS